MPRAAAVPRGPRSLKPRSAFRRLGGLFDLVVAALCLWAAYFNTPVGSLLRQSVARVLRLQTTAQPVLSYFRTSPAGGAAWAGREVPRAPELAMSGEHRVGTSSGPPLTADAALGLAVVGTLHELGPGRAPYVAAQARDASVKPELLFDVTLGPPLATRVVQASGSRLGSAEAGVLALFVPEDVVRFAVERTRAEGEDLTVDSLAGRLPPDQRAGAEEAAAVLSLATAYALRWPVSEAAPITSPFGWRVHPVLGEPRKHLGVDVGVPSGTDVHATGAGEVRRSSEDALNGKIVVIDHGHGVSTAYCHNSELLVRVGEHVSVGDLIARSGMTGRATGPHVHYQVELADVPVDPLRLRQSEPPKGLTPKVPDPAPPLGKHAAHRPSKTKAK